MISSHCFVLLIDLNYFYYYTEIIYLYIYIHFTDKKR
nr:MAG TPA: hypothetical protein [Caudoviricetes sp.]